MSLTSRKVILDPSVFVARYSFHRLRRYLDQDHGHSKMQLFLPNAFLQFLQETRFHPQHPVIKYYLQRARPLTVDDVGQLYSIIEERIQPFAADDAGFWFWTERQQYLGNLDEHFRRVDREHGELLLQILFEEWFFLFSQSWFLSRTQKALNTLCKTGLALVDFGREGTREIRESLDGAIRSGLNIGQDVDLTPQFALLGITKYLSVGLTVPLGLGGVSREASQLFEEIASDDIMLMLMLLGELRQVLVTFDP